MEEKVDEKNMTEEEEEAVREVKEDEADYSER